MYNSTNVLQNHSLQNCLKTEISYPTVQKSVCHFLWRYFRINYQPESDQPLLNKRSAQFIGRIFPLYEAIENRRGKIKVDDSIWTVQGQDSPLESKVEVIAVKGMILKVKLVDED